MAAKHRHHFFLPSIPVENESMDCMQSRTPGIYNSFLFLRFGILMFQRGGITLIKKKGPGRYHVYSNGYVLPSAPAFSIALPRQK